MRGPHIFRGYCRDDEATAVVLDEDGWLHSGDLGTLTDEGYLKITGRKKDLIITSSGKNITPANIESALRILDHDLTQAGGELTPTLKVKRNVVYGKYADFCSDIYTGA